MRGVELVGLSHTIIFSITIIIIIIIIIIIADLNLILKFYVSWRQKVDIW